MGFNELRVQHLSLFKKCCVALGISLSQPRSLVALGLVPLVFSLWSHGVTLCASEWTIAHPVSDSIVSFFLDGCLATGFWTGPTICHAAV